jgi:hypothetical protein
MTIPSLAIIGVRVEKTRGVDPTSQPIDVKYRGNVATGVTVNGLSISDVVED